MNTRHASTLIVLALLIAAAPPAHAGTVEIVKSTIDAGGGTSTGGAIQITGTIGQPDTGWSSTGLGLEITGGFWPGLDGGPPPCPPDLDGDLVVGFQDLLALLSAWGACPGCAADLDGNDTVDFQDLLFLLAAWGPCP